MASGPPAWLKLPYSPSGPNAFSDDRCNCEECARRCSGGFAVLYKTNRVAFNSDANAAGKFRSWAAPLRARSPAFRSLPKLSTRGWKIPVVDGRIPVVGGTIQESGERILLAVKRARTAIDCVWGQAECTRKWTVSLTRGDG